MSWDRFPKLERQGQIEFLQKPDGSRLRVAIWTADKNTKGVVVLVNGFREYMEKYSELIDDFLKKGFAIYAMDNRGQGLSDRMVEDRHKSYIDDFDTYLDDLNFYVRTKVTADTANQGLPLFLVAHSMGGHIGLRYVHDHPDIFHKAVLMAPMIKLKLGNGFLDFITRSVVRGLQRLGRSKDFAPGQGDGLEGGRRMIARNILTHNKARYDVEEKIFQRTPDLYAGGATIGWMAAAMDSMNKIQEPGYMNAIALPLLICVAGKDKLLDSRATEDLMHGRDNCTVILFGNSYHEIYQETDDIRDRLLEEIDSFLAV